MIFYFLTELYSPGEAFVVEMLKSIYKPQSKFQGLKDSVTSPKSLPE